MTPLLTLLEERDIDHETLRKTLEAVSEQICEIIVQTDWANNSSKGVERLSDLSAQIGEVLEITSAE